MRGEKRIVGEYSTSDDKGPLLFVTAGIHGNEPSGIVALEKVFGVLEREKPVISGKIVGVRGNVKALKNGVRFIDEDLNRTWTEQNVVQKVRDTNEKKEMFEIMDLLEKYPGSSFSKRYFLDCHTTSSESVPYISVQETGGNDAWAHRFSTYIIRGFSDIVDGCIDHYLSRTGLTGFVFEGGQHKSGEAVRNHEGMIWKALENACGLDLDQLKVYPNAAKVFSTGTDQPKTFEILYRHAIEDGDVFRMEKGYGNFRPIVTNELLAIHNGEEVRSKWDAFVFMPLYQAQGNDGFFVVREVC
tara:strand:- start:39692 stop:40591 length:900 start_codon:yes stop_codon:yes gene_type:complete